MDSATLSSIFEIGMLTCFGASWPFAVLKTYRSKSVGGKSVLFIWLVLTGYISGVFFKAFGRLDWVVALYVFNAILVATDLALYYRYRHGGARPATADSR